MDDFGAGYASLGYLRRFPFDEIKIVRSFVSELGRRNDSVVIVRAIISRPRRSASRRSPRVSRAKTNSPA